ncbi:MAG TPA: c-type cytochrome [Dehalococcoidia bacterium]|nr:c-type cytochrome [Dehalococcoidia bacterium]
MGSDALTSLSENGPFVGVLAIQALLLLLLFTRIQQGPQSRLAILVDKIPFLPGVVLIFLPFLLWMILYAARGGPSGNSLSTAVQPTQSVAAAGEVDKAASVRPTTAAVPQGAPWEIALNPTAQQLDVGKRLVQEQNCLACHRIQGKGGEVASDLGGVGNRRSAEWIYQHFQDPQKMSSGTLMPKFHISEQEIISLTAYMLALKQ